MLMMLTSLVLLVNLGKLMLIMLNCLGLVVECRAADADDAGWPRAFGRIGNSSCSRLWWSVGSWGLVVEQISANSHHSTFQGLHKNGNGCRGHLPSKL